MTKRLSITSLPSGLADMDEVLMHAAFQCLVDYIELECDGEDAEIEFNEELVRLDPETTKYERDATEEHNRHARECNELYNWWIERRKDDYYPPDPEQWEQDTVMLHRLVEIRGSMWT